ncbi:MAG: methyltransferase [Gammaproteobacteria bacterium]
MISRSMAFTGAVATVFLMNFADAGAAGSIPAGVKAAVADASRPDADKQRDANRKPAETLAFTGIKKGDHVAELLPGGGYFTRIISKVVGDKGVVYAVAPPKRPNAPADAPEPSAAVAAIAADAGYKNVRVMTARVTELTLPEPVDVVWTSLNYHDIHNVPNADLKAVNTTIFNALKPGGTYIVIDHAAEKGSGARDTSTLHRIDPEIVKTEVQSAGFVLAGESDVLRNAEDPHTAGVRDPSIQGKTDQFILKFKKPAK